jgi:probable HAF family extracellular repeat protein
VREQNRKHSRPSPRHLHLEVLEDRCLLSYTLTDWTPIMTVNGMNNLGQIVGMGRADDGRPHALVWDPAAGIRDLGEGAAGLINDAGQVAGGALIDGVWHAVFWDSDGVITGKYSGLVPSAINNAGQLAGTIDIGMGYYHAGLWDPAAGVQDLGSLGGLGVADGADSINDAGVVVGGSDTPSGYEHAFVWDGTNGMQDLTPGAMESFATGINNAGQIVGNADGDAFLAEGGTLTRLGQWVPQAINNAGQIVGRDLVLGTFHGVLYADGVLRELNSLIPPGTGLTIYIAYGINDLGWIRADALDAQSHHHSVVLTPDGGPSPGRVDTGLLRVLAPAPEAARAGDSAAAPQALPVSVQPGPMALAPLAAGAAGRPATDAFFVSGHRTHTPAQGGAWEVEGLGLGLFPEPTAGVASLLPSGTRPGPA